MDLSIIVPAYNEENRIERTIEDYVDYFKNTIKNFEILIIVNGSRDNTYAIANELARRYEQIKTYNFIEKIGKGGAIIQGFKVVSGELIGFVDADNSTSAKAFHDLVSNIDGYDGVIASRWIKGSKILVLPPLSRRICSRCFNILVRLLFGLGIRDTQCGAKLFSKKAIKEVLPYLGITQWAFDIDLLYQMKRKNYKLIEIPTEWQEHGGSHLNLKKVIPEMFLSIVRLRLVYSPFKFIVDIFNYIKDIIKKTK